MSSCLITEKQNLTYLNWSHLRNSSGTAGTLLKSQSDLDGVKKYYKLSTYDPERGIVGHECINELIVDRLLDVLGVEHLHYELIHADVLIEGKLYDTYVCASEDFKHRGESKIALDDYYRLNADNGESHYDFCIRMGWQEQIDRMIAIDFLIMNRDRHGANIEILRDSVAKTLRIAPLFDHGLSLLCSCFTEQEIAEFDTCTDRRCNNFIGCFSCLDNLHYIQDKKALFPNELELKHRKQIFDGLEHILSNEHMDKIWDMIWERYKLYESI